jgi:aminoglycoside 6'-N-acetyltransferase I
MPIERCTTDHLDDWARLRQALWPESTREDHRRELARQLSSGGPGVVAFVSRVTSGEVVGFAEATLRHDPVNGCDTSPVLFLEGIYVVPAHRRRGVAKSLCEAIEAWGRSLGCTEFGSDALLDNAASHAFHSALGFEECERVVVFRKLL